VSREDLDGECGLPKAGNFDNLSHQLIVPHSYRYLIAGARLGVLSEDLEKSFLRGCGRPEERHAGIAMAGCSTLTVVAKVRIVIYPLPLFSAEKLTVDLMVGVTTRVTTSTLEVQVNSRTASRTLDGNHLVMALDSRGVGPPTDVPVEGVPPHEHLPG
jgi:hypothetical protein